MEERSSKRPQPSGDWKPYEREKEPRERPQSSGDWKPYEQDEEQSPRSEDSDSSRGQPNEKTTTAEARRSDRESTLQNDGEEGQRGDSERHDSEHQPSTVDAMGREKHREVIGQRYGASRGRQFLYYGIFIAVVIGGYIGLKSAADSLDKAPAKDADQAPWSKPNAPGEPLGGFQPDSPGQKGATDFQ